MIKIYEVTKRPNEMAMSKSDAIDRCISLGTKFIEHFHKVYTNPQSESLNHWVNAEMQPWLNAIRNITLKPNNKHLLCVQISDWFLTAGSNYSDLITDCDDEELEAYDKFSLMIMSGKDVEESLAEIGIIIKN